jgi:type I restriction enzyme M protein
MKADGKSLDDKRNLLVDPEVLDSLKFPEGLVEEEKLQLHEKFNIPDILERFPGRNKDSRARTEQSFLVPKKEIEENDWDLSINSYEKLVYEEIEYDSPSKIIEDINKLDVERNQLLKKLEL